LVECFKRCFNFLFLVVGYWEYVISVPLHSIAALAPAFASLFFLGIFLGHGTRNAVDLAGVFSLHLILLVVILVHFGPGVIRSDCLRVHYEAYSISIINCKENSRFVLLGEHFPPYLIRLLWRERFANGVCLLAIVEHFLLASNDLVLHGRLVILQVRFQGLLGSFQILILLP
jgi:hypothetical protein